MKRFILPFFLRYFFAIQPAVYQFWKRFSLLDKAFNFDIQKSKKNARITWAMSVVFFVSESLYFFDKYALLSFCLVVWQNQLAVYGFESVFSLFCGELNLTWEKKTVAIKFGLRSANWTLGLQSKWICILIRFWRWEKSSDKIS